MMRAQGGGEGAEEIVRKLVDGPVVTFVEEQVVPDVEAVGEHAEPDQRSAVQQAIEPGAREGDGGGDQETDGSELQRAADGEQITAVELDGEPGDRRKRNSKEPIRHRR